MHTTQTVKPENRAVTDDATVALSYLLSGILLYGGLGFLADYCLQTSWLLPLGLILGMAASIYMIIRRYGSAE